MTFNSHEYEAYGMNDIHTKSKLSKRELITQQHNMERSPCPMTNQYFWLTKLKKTLKAQQQHKNARV